MSRSLEQSLAWVEEGTALCRKAIAGLDEASYDAPTHLAGWTRRHLVAHLAANAEAVGNLVHWAATGEETRMYSSSEQRKVDIEAGAMLTGERLTDWFDRSARALAEAMEALPAVAWQAEVITAQGRTVPASETPWMRSREVMVHAADLGTGLNFVDLPEDFLAALREDIAAYRGAENLLEIHGTEANVTAYLAGRPYSDVTTPEGAPATDLPPWL
jgi:maleylpyruvate isomerase